MNLESKVVAWKFPRAYGSSLSFTRPDGQLEWDDEPSGVEALVRLSDAQQALEAVERERDSLLADAMRYRWLRDIGDATWRPFGLRDGCSAKLADAAIDAAIAAAGQDDQKANAEQTRK